MENIHPICSEHWCSVTFRPSWSWFGFPARCGESPFLLRFFFWFFFSVVRTTWAAFAACQGTARLIPGCPPGSPFPGKAHTHQVCNSSWLEPVFTQSLYFSRSSFFLAWPLLVTVTCSSALPASGEQAHCGSSQPK